MFKILSTSVLILFTLTNSQGCQYEHLVYLSSPPGWASQNNGTTGGNNTQPITITTLEDLQKHLATSEPKTIIINGTIGEGLSTKIQVNSNKTIIGQNGALLKGSFYIKDAQNVIIRNLIIEGPGAIDVNGPDCITVDNSTNIWLDHLDVYDGQDGNIDIVNGSNYVTVSWCKFYYTSASINHKLCTLIGNSDEKIADRGKLKTTMIYNWWTNGVDSRMPRVRFGQVHVVNNLYTSEGNDYCILAGTEADLRVEYNIFKNVNEPINLSKHNFTAVSVLKNHFVSTSGNTSGKGQAFNPPYHVKIIPLNFLEMLIRKHAGATITNIQKILGTAT
ncbi:MAG: pectate lyase [Candidatus Hydrogenedens sp.]|nr:pectate lyase [Candidatus Hydrogenedens sp.]